MLAGRGARGGAVSDSREPTLAVGTRVQVRNRFLSDFAPGFEVAGVSAAGYVERRLSDGGELPVPFGDDEVQLDLTAR